jgi:hypothetical protein
VIIARSDAWIEITQGNMPVVKRMLRRGEQYVVPPGSGMHLRTGNAGGTQISVGGKMVASLGASGDVASGISLAADDLRQRVAE